MIKKFVSAVLLLLFVAGTALAVNYVYVCTSCGLTQQYTMVPMNPKCSACGKMMRMKQSYE
jgi:tRNA G26 N,N-dimethylase Trm1